jgi:outer membrane protein OmpA-like peptidoglycan-associated protein
MREMQALRPVGRDTVFIKETVEKATRSAADSLFYVARYPMGALLPENLDQVMQRVARAIEGRSDYTVKIAVHTDRSGSAAANMSISRRRAELLSSELVKHGVLNTNTFVQWFGSTYASDEVIEFERRAEITVILPR